MLLVLCFMLLSCPPAHYFNYEYIGKNSLGADGYFTQLKFNDSIDIKIECGVYYEFVSKKERGLLTRILINKNKEFDFSDMNINVTSSKIGILEKRESPYMTYLDSLPEALVYFKKIEKKGQDRILKLLENDTLTIKIGDKIKYQFVKK